MWSEREEKDESKVKQKNRIMVGNDVIRRLLAGPRKGRSFYILKGKGKGSVDGEHKANSCYVIDLRCNTFLIFIQLKHD